MATLIGYGASAINPYVMFESLDELADHSLLPVDLDQEEAEKRIVKAIGKGLMKTISKMGHLHDPVLLRRPDLRGGRTRA